MSGLTDFLLARLAEDEADARHLRQLYDGDRLDVPAALINARALVDPDRVLAECEAKRRIVAEHADVDGTCRSCEDVPWPCPTLRFLALPYADHPDYRQEWKP